MKRGDGRSNEINKYICSLILSIPSTFFFFFMNPLKKKKTCLRDIFKHNNATFKIYQRRPAASTRRRRRFSSFFPPQPPYSNLLQCVALGDGPLNLRSARPSPTLSRWRVDLSRFVADKDPQKDALGAAWDVDHPRLLCKTCSGNLADEQPRLLWQHIHHLRRWWNVSEVEFKFNYHLFQLNGQVVLLWGNCFNTLGPPACSLPHTFSGRVLNCPRRSEILDGDKVSAPACSDHEEEPGRWASCCRPVW